MRRSSINNPPNLSLNQLGQMNRRDILIDELNQDLLSQQQTEPLVQVTAEPMTPENSANYDGVEVNSDAQDALQTPLPMPNPSKIAASVEPGQTEAVKAAENTDEAAENTDEYEPLFEDYERARRQYKTDIKNLEKETEQGESDRMRMTGIAGALSAFGEGLAAITGGSAKPLRAGVEAVQQMGTQQAAAQERKAKSLKERLQMAREPIETRAADIKFRDVFEKKQLQKNLADPNSEQSKQARDVANQTLNALVASFRSAGNEQAANELLNTKQFIDTASGAQINQLFEQIKDFGIKPTISADQKQQNALQLIERKGDIQQKLSIQKQQFQSKLTNIKTDAARVNAATKQYSDIVPKIEAEVKDVKELGKEINKFIDLLNQASDPKLMSNEVKRKQINDAIAAQKGILNYMNARKYESKGVFTDQDLIALSELRTYGTWADQFSNWLKKGVYNEETANQIKVMRNIMIERKRDFKNPGYAIARGYAQIFRDTADLYSTMDNNIDSARTLLHYSNSIEKKFSPDIVGKFNNQEELKQKINSGEVKLEDGDIVEIQGSRYEKIGNRMEPIK